MDESNEQEGMYKRRITLADGRYLIFYTFDEPVAATANHASAERQSRREPDAEPEAEEERHV
jgi:hypothetical protein